MKPRISLLICLILLNAALAEPIVTYTSNTNKSFDEFISGTNSLVMYVSNSGEPLQVDINDPTMGYVADFWSRLASFFAYQGIRFVPLNALQNKVMFESINSRCDIAKMQFETQQTGNIVSSVGLIFRSCPGENGVEEVYRFDFKTRIRWDLRAFSKIAEVIENNFRFRYQYNVSKRNLLASNRITSIRNFQSASNIVNDYNGNPVVGIWESFMPSEVQTSYTLAVLPSAANSNEFEIVYLSSNKFRDDWQAGEIKGYVRTTGVPGLYKVEWYSGEKSLTNNVYAELTTDGFLGFRFTPDEITKYIRLTPAIKTEMPVNEGGTSFFTPIGTGVLVSNYGYILTCWHVVESVAKPKVTFPESTNGEPIETEVVFQDKSNDLAILKITDSLFIAQIPTYGISNSRLSAGENVFTIGYPLTSIMGQAPKVSEGIVSSTTGFQDDATTFQISAPVQPGNSGGPLFDSNGNLIGIVNARLSLDLAENVSYAIKIRYAQALADMSEKPLLGEQPSKVTNLSLANKVAAITPFVCLIGK